MVNRHFVQSEREVQMISKPKLEDRKEQPYVGIRTQVPMGKMKKVIPQLLGEVSAWLEQRGAAPAGPPFMRFHVINMATNMDIELGFPVATAMSGNARVSAGAIPAGRYASLIYTGNGIKANKALIDWAAEHGIRWDSWDDENGDAFRARIETYLTDPDEEPNRAKWQTEVAIRLADDQASSQALKEK
jgi:effector-binding domain-containing protein